MKYLVLLAIVVQALAAPPGKPGNNRPGNGNPFGPQDRPLPPPSNEVQPFGRPNITGPPPKDNSLASRPPPPGIPNQRPRRAAGDVARSGPPPKDGNPPYPKPAGGNPPATGKPPVNGSPQNRPEQPPALRPRRHLKGVEGRPTGAPHVENHTHDITGSHPPRPTQPFLGTAGKHGDKGHGAGPGEKGHGAGPGKKH